MGTHTRSDTFRSRYPDTHCDQLSHDPTPDCLAIVQSRWHEQAWLPTS